MIFIKALTYKDIEKNLGKNDVITIIGCELCSRSSGISTESKMKELAVKLRADGFNIKDGYMIPGACSPKILFAKLGKDVNAIISLACDAGTSNIKRYFSKYKIVAATYDVGLMVTDSDKKILEVTMPFQKSSNEVGKEYGLFTGENLKSDNNLITMEVSK